MGSFYNSAQTTLIIIRQFTSFHAPSARRLQTNHVPRLCIQAHFAAQRLYFTLLDEQILSRLARFATLPESKLRGA